MSFNPWPHPCKLAADWFHLSIQLTWLPWGFQENTSEGKTKIIRLIAGKTNATSQNQGPRWGNQRRVLQGFTGWVEWLCVGCDKVQWAVCFPSVSQHQLKVLVRTQSMGMPQCFWFSASGVRPELWICNKCLLSGTQTLRTTVELIGSIYTFNQFSQTGSHAQLFYHHDVDRDPPAGLWLTGLCNPQGVFFFFSLLSRAVL